MLVGCSTKNADGAFKTRMTMVGQFVCYCLQDDKSGGDASTLFTVSADPMQGLEPARPKDFVIFVNLVDFCR